MTRSCGRARRLVALLGMAACTLSPSVVRAAEPPFATLEAAGGDVMVIRLGQQQQPAPEMPLQRNDVVVTKQGRATVRFQPDGTVLRIGPDSRIQIDETAQERGVTVFFGRIWAHVVRWKEQTTRFSSNSTIAAIRGTELTFGVAVNGDETQVAVLEGHVETKTDAGSLVLNGGQVAAAKKGSAPALRAQVRPSDAVQWALYYPPVLHVASGSTTGAAWEDKVRASASEYQKGNLKGALDQLAGVEAQGARDPRFLGYRASLLLATGNVEDATKDIDRALELAPNDADALALQTVMAVAGNQPDKALESARRAVAADPKSATAQTALSYARQAHFDLAGAQESLEAAVRLDPNDALAWARLAEVRSSSGHLDEALAAARKATELEPNLARTQTVLGFTYLTEVKTHDATAAFQKAIELDQADPLPRLGLGLAQIREGGLEKGLGTLETAVSLDPGQSLLRSYLAKAYFEAKRGALASRDFEVAKKLDPKDPTPWLYDAISKQTTNQPVEALQDLEQAIDLNDNRAVYRSRLLLDSDLAARSASLGRIYADLGFQELALVEGWDSVNTDPSNYSAHRLLADSYAALPRHEIARVSELFQSQMLQPLNTTPIQPRLGESNLFLISSQGPGTVGFNEFNPLFNRNQVNGQGSFLVGQDNTLSGEGIVSGIYDKLSFSAGYSGFKTDGFRENASQDDKIANAFAQVQVTPSTSLQAEVRHRKTENGDISLLFDPEDFNTKESETDKITNERVGLRHDFGPSVTLLGSYMHADKDIDSSVPDPQGIADFALTQNEKADSVEGQVLFRSARVRAVTGAGYFGIKATRDRTLDFPLDGITSVKTFDSKTNHTNLYLYTYLALQPSLTLTLGLSGDLFEESGTALESAVFAGIPPDAPAPSDPEVLGKKDQANPKIGLSWTTKTGTTLRGAWFKALKRTLVTDQTLEPTQVSGFNQFFDDPSATQSTVWGAAVDQTFSKTVFGGVEYSQRDLTVPQSFSEDGQVTFEVKERDGDEHLARGYLFAAPHRFVTVGAEYQYERLTIDPAAQFNYSVVKTQRVPLSVRFFHPSGWGGYLGVTYLKQDGEFRNSLSSDFVLGNRDFWVVDAALRYRLPKRFGFLVAGVNNLTDERSTYLATDSKSLPIRPGRVAFARVVLAVP